MNNHRYSINNNADNPVARHFNSPNHALKHLKIIAFDYLPTADTHSRLNKETYWIHKLQTMEPNGINVKEQLSFPISIYLSNQATTATS